MRFLITFFAFNAVILLNILIVCGFPLARGFTCCE